MKIKSIKELIKYIQSNNLTDVQESYIRSTHLDSLLRSEIENESN